MHDLSEQSSALHGPKKSLVHASCQPRKFATKQEIVIKMRKIALNLHLPVEKLKKVL